MGVDTAFKILVWGAIILLVFNAIGLVSAFIQSAVYFWSAVDLTKAAPGGMDHYNYGGYSPESAARTYILGGFGGRLTAGKLAGLAASFLQIAAAVFSLRVLLRVTQAA